MKTLMLTHNDLDACGAIIVAKLFSLDIDEYKFCGYDDLYDADNDKVVLDIGDSYDRVFMTDLACNRNMYDYLKTHTKSFGVFDHHERTVQVENEDEVHFDVTRSGTEVFFDAIKSHMEDVPEKWSQFVKIVSAYDLWLLDSPLRPIAEDLNRLYFAVLNYSKQRTYEQYRFFIETQMEKLLDQNVDDFGFTDWEQTKIEYAKEKEYKEYKAATENMQIKIDNMDRKYIIYHGSSKVSHVCSRLLAENPDAAYVLNFNTYTGTRKKKISGRISARSLEGFDVTTLSGINGHKEAGGGMFKESLLKRIWYYPGVHLNYKEEE